MGKKIISAIAAVGLLAAGVYLGSELGSNNSATIVGGADRYAQKSGATSAAVGVTSMSGRSTSDEQAARKPAAAPSKVAAATCSAVATPCCSSRSRTRLRRSSARSG